MNKREIGYRILESLAYPATLGAALAWWIQAVAFRSDGGTPRPTYWALFFGFWFLVYHSVWYGFLITAPKASGGVLPLRYERLTLVTDFLDTVAMMMGFAGLGFAAGHYDK